MMPDQLAAAPPGVYLGPLGAEGPDTEVVQPRVTKVILTKHAATFLVHCDGVAPATAYQDKLAGMFAADGVLESCGDVLA